MDLTRFRELYAAEADEHLARLGAALLALEAGDSAEPLAEAFRAVHTVKGLAATMGFSEVSAIAHALEDRLAAVRQGSKQVTGDMLDEFLAEADRLEAAVHTSLADGPAPAAGIGPSDAASDGAAGAQDLEPPEDYDPARETLALVRLRPDALLKAARALIVIRSVAGHARVLGTTPQEFGEEFDGIFFIRLPRDTDNDNVAAAIRSAGDVESVTFGPARAEPAGVARRSSSAVAGSPAARPMAAQVRVAQQRLDTVSEAVGELAILHTRLGLAAGSNGSGEDGAYRQMGRVMADLQAEIQELRLAPLSDVFDRLPRLVRDVARQLRKDVELRIEGREIRLDRAILEELSEPLVHLVRNALDHGLEQPDARAAAGKPRRGTLWLSAERERNSVRITIRDDGRGIGRERVMARGRELMLIDPDADATDFTDEDIFRLLSHPSFTTADQVTSVSGRGVGLDAVAGRVRALGGATDMQTERGAGTTFTIRLPITHALVQSLRVRLGDEDYAVPLTHVTEVVDFADVGLTASGGRELLLLRDAGVPLVRLRRALGVGTPGEERAAVIAEMGGRRAALAVDELVGREQILVKSFAAPTGTLPYFSGATLLADGRPALVLDPLSVL